MKRNRMYDWWPFPGLDLFGAALCAALVAVGYGLELFAGMEPCPFCLLERYLLLGLGLGFLLVAAATPRGWGHAAAAALLLIPAGTGLAATIYHLRIQSGAVESTCGQAAANPALNHGLSIATGAARAPGWEAWLPQSQASCATPDLFLGINLVVWALAAFAVLGGIGVAAHFGASLRARADDRRYGKLL